jgi:Peptidase A4 family
LNSLTASLLAAALGASAAAASAAPRTDPATVANRAIVARAASDLPTSASTNWAGYAVAAPDGTGSSFTSVTGTWKQPRVSCTAARPAYSAAWVGLGGADDGSLALEQIGTDADCTAGGAPRYFAWYELVPAPPVPLNLRILPGDTITASVNVSGTGVLVQIKDRTRKTSFTRQLDIASPDVSSAEWIVEAPSACTANGACLVLPLANFGSVTFTKIATIGNRQPGTISSEAWSASAIRLLPDSSAQVSRSTPGGSGASPTTLAPDGRSFTVQWQPNPNPSATP